MEIATHPILVNQLQHPLSDVLQQALESHRYALTLDQDNPDTLFNTAQVLTAIAELYAKDPSRSDHEASQLLAEALELQDRCLAVQELRLEDYIQQQNEATAQINSNNPEPQTSESVSEKSDEDAGPSSTRIEDQWFSIVEPVTKDTLIETILAELGTLTTLCSILCSAPFTPTANLAWIEEFSSKLIKVKLPALLDDAETERIQEVALARANFLSSLLEAGYRSGSIDPTAYKRERDEAFQLPELDLGRSFPALMANASSLIAFNSALADGDPSHAESLAAQRWNALSAAIANMVAASKISGPVPEDIAETHFVRGNCSLLQHQLSLPPTPYQPAVINGAQLLKNADVFYRNASKLYQIGEQKAVSQFRASISQALQTGENVISAAASNDQGQGSHWAKVQFDDMVDDGLISPAGVVV